VNKLELTPEERKECLEAYVFEYMHSRKTFADRLHLNIMLKKIGLDADEVKDVFDSLEE
jgi:hypothetical protein